MKHSSFVVAFIIALPGCNFRADPGEPGDPTSRDIAHYNEVTAELEQARTRFGGEAIGEMYPAGSMIYWLEYRGTWDPTVHSLDTESGRRVDYDLALEFDSLNVRVSPTAIACAELDGLDVIYHVYDASQPSTEITRLVMSAPSGEQRWWAYALDGEDLYIVVTKSEDSPDTKLYRARPGTTERTLVTTFESAGATVGEFWDFGLQDEQLIFVESGRIWSFDLTSNRATWLRNDTEVGGNIDFGPSGVLFTTARGPRFFDYQTSETIDISARIASAEYRLNDTYTNIHLFSEGMARWQNYVIYGGQSGVFAYDMNTNEVTPILLEPRFGDTSDVRVVYKDPVVLENGTLFILGLESASGSVGADGPVYRVDLASVLD